MKVVPEPPLDPTRDALATRVLELIARGTASEDTHPKVTEVTEDIHPTPVSGGLVSADVSEDTHPRVPPALALSGLEPLLHDLATYQSTRVVPYRQLCSAHARLQPTAAASWAPAMPTDVFRYARVASYPPSEDTHVFRTSGTSSGARGVHPFRSLALYDAAARAHARRMLFPDTERIQLVMLAEHPANAPESSLSYMLGRFETWFGAGPAAWCLRDATLDVDALIQALEHATAAHTPVALLGTSFAFVFAEDALHARRFELPVGSRIMQTGGYKGRSREVEPSALRGMLCARYGLDDAYIVAEYGMTELSSQLYEASLRDRLEGHPSPRRHLVPPPWMRATPVDPESLQPVVVGQVGVLRIDDAANLDSVAAILTSDLASATPDGGILLHGRATGASLRGCSLAVEEALGGTGRGA